MVDLSEEVGLYCLPGLVGLLLVQEQLVSLRSGSQPLAYRQGVQYLAPPRVHLHLLWISSWNPLGLRCRPLPHCYPRYFRGKTLTFGRD